MSKNYQDALEQQVVEFGLDHSGSESFNYNWADSKAYIMFLISC